MNTDKFQAFQDEFRKQMNKAAAENPARYGYPTPERIESIVITLSQAAQIGTVDKSGTAMQATMKALKIRNTYKALKEYFSA